jgi:hypothetical protein
VSVEEVPIPGGKEESDLFKRFTSNYDAPAYVRRARQVHEVYEQLLGRCRQEREEMLQMVRIRLGVLQALTGDWVRLRPWLADEEEVRVLECLTEAVPPALRGSVGLSYSRWQLRTALNELLESLERFNRRWQAFLLEIDLTMVNQVREGYNRYYLLEKECAIRSPMLARHGFERISPLTHADLFAALPLLPVPRLK